MDDGVAVEVINGGDDTVLEFLLGCDADMAQHRAGELGEETLDEIKPGAVLGREDEFEAAGGLLGEPQTSLPNQSTKATSHVDKNESSARDWFHGIDELDTIRVEKLRELFS